MKIGISCTPLYTIKRSQKKIDGIGVYTANLCQALTQQNVEIKEIYFKKLKELTQPKNLKENNFNLAMSPLFSLLPNFYQSLPTKIDLLHITNYLVPRIKNIPTISTIHDSFMLTHPEWQNGYKNLNYLKGCILKKLTREIDHVVTGSQASVTDIVNYWKIPEKKISVIYYGLSEEWNQKSDAINQQIVLNKYGLVKPFFLTVATFQPRKNIARIINAYLNLPKRIIDNFTLVIVGEAHPSLIPASLIKQLSQLENMGRLFWLKYVTFDDLRCLYQSAKALLYPSLAEGFGFPILEGFASGTPVITTHSGATAEIAGGAAYLVDPYSEEAITTGMCELIENTTLRDQLIQQGFSRVKLFTWEKYAQETIKIYKKFI
jgi:glycosyltransferase involved in cell wall biosynthesis